MKIAVIIPSYNRATVLARALDSILQQSMPVHDIIVVDDGSTDNTENVIKQTYPDVLYLKTINKGVSHARNIGINHTDADWIALLDSDDEWHPEKIAEQIKTVAKTGDKICHTNEIWFRNNKIIKQKKRHAKKGGWIFQYCLPMCRISPSAVIIHREIFDDVGLFDENLAVCEDYDLWLRITAKYRVSFCEQALTHKHGGHADQLSFKYWGMDRFRIQALNKIIKQCNLNDVDKKAAIAMLKEKINLFLAGADKHNNSTEIKSYQEMIELY